MQFSAAAEVMTLKTEFLLEPMLLTEGLYYEDETRVFVFHVAMLAMNKMHHQMLTNRNYWAILLAAQHTITSEWA